MLAELRTWATTARVLTILSLAALGSAALFMTIGANGHWDFVLPFRGLKLATLALVGTAIAASTVVFQTVTGNRILTPSIMGFDALYMLIQTSVVFFIGLSTLTTADPRVLFVIQALALSMFALALFRFLFRGAARDLHLLLLSGIVFGILFRSLSAFMRRVIEPDAFLVLQDSLFASFNKANPELLGVSALLVAGVLGVLWSRRAVFDVLALGRETAVSLGLDYRREVSIALVCVTVLVAVSTALVGPVTFFGLLVANLAYGAVPTHRHTAVLPAAALIAVLCLVGGQLVLERVFGFDGALSVIVEFAGGIVFITMIVMRGAR